MEWDDIAPDEPSAQTDATSPAVLGEGTATPSTDFKEFLDTLLIDREQILDGFGINLLSDGFAADFNCVFARDTSQLFLQLMPSSIPSDRNVQRVCSQLANSLVNLAEQLGAVEVNLCIKKGNKSYAVWMRSCLYVGFSLISSARARKVVESPSTVVLRCKLDYSCEKDFLSDGTASTCDGSDIFSPRHRSPRSSLDGSCSLDGSF